MWIVTYYDLDGNDFFKEFKNAEDAYKFVKEIEKDYSVLVTGESYGLHGQSRVRSAREIINGMKQ